MAIKTSKVLLFSAVLLAGSCQVAQQDSSNPNSAKNNSAEELLAAQGTWNMVEEKQPVNPLNQHLKAKSQVDSRDRSAKRSYTKETSDEELNEEVHFRVLKLEKEMQTLQKDFKKLLPPLSNLIVSDNELDRAISEIQETNMDTEAHANRMASAPKSIGVVAKYAAPKPATKKPEAKTPVVKGGPNAVVALRRGEHKDKTRLVLDIKNKAKINYDLDNNEKLLLVELPGVGWETKDSGSFKDHPLVKSYSAKGSGDGTTLALELKKPVKVLLSSVLGPNSVNPNHRYVLDIAAQ